MKPVVNELALLFIIVNETGEWMPHTARSHDLIDEYTCYDGAMQR